MKKKNKAERHLIYYCALLNYKKAINKPKINLGLCWFLNEACIELFDESCTYHELKVIFPEFGQFDRYFSRKGQTRWYHNYEVTGKRINALKKMLEWTKNTRNIKIKKQKVC